jgi:hypothetical protein
MLELTICQFSLSAKTPFQLVQVYHRFQRNPQNRLVSMQAVRNFHEKHVGENLLFEYKKVGDHFVETQYRTDDPGMLHVKCKFRSSTVEIKFFPSGKVMVTASRPPATDRGDLVGFLEEVQDFIEGVSGHSDMTRKLNLVRADITKFRDGSFDREYLKGVLQPDFSIVKDSDTLAERVQAFDKERKSFSVFFQRRGKVQVVISSKDAPNLSVQMVFDFIGEIQGIVKKIEARVNRNNVYMPNVTNISECNGNPMPTPRTFQGACPDGYFVTPSKRGAPCCKAIPKYVRSKTFWEPLAAKYRSFGIPIPDSLYSLTGRSRSSPKKSASPGKNSPKKNSPRHSPSSEKTLSPASTTNAPARSKKTKKVVPAGTVIAVQGRGEIAKRGKQEIYRDFYINGTECFKMHVADIKAIGAYLGHDIKHLRTGAKICQAIDKQSRKQGVVALRRSNGYNQNNVQPRVSPTVSLRSKLKNGFVGYKCAIGTKKRGFYGIDEIQGMAQILGIRGYSKMRKVNLCTKIKEALA